MKNLKCQNQSQDSQTFCTFSPFLSVIRFFFAPRCSVLLCSAAHTARSSTARNHMGRQSIAPGISLGTTTVKWKERHINQRPRPDDDNSLDWNALPHGRRADAQILRIFVFAALISRLGILHAGLPVQKTALPDGAPALESNRSRVTTEATRDRLCLSTNTSSVARSRVTRAGGCCRQMWDVFGKRMTGADVGDAHVRSLAGLAQRVISRVEVLSFLKEPLGEANAEQRVRGNRNTPSACSGEGPSWLAPCHRDAADAALRDSRTAAGQQRQSGLAHWGKRSAHSR